MVNSSGSAGWSDFRRETFGDPYSVWHDGADFTVLRQRWDTDPEHVESMLRTGLTEADPLAAQAIEVLLRTGGGPQEVRQSLELALHDATGTFRVRVAQALLFVTGDQRYAQAICDVLVDGPHWADRADAAIALNGFEPTPRVVSALAAAVQDEEYLVRRHSAQSLLTLARRYTTIEHVPELWAKIKTGSAAQQWRDAADELVQPWAAGGS